MTVDYERLERIWHLALHCRMLVYAHDQLENLGLMETGAPPIGPVEANYHQFAAMHALTVLCVVDPPRKGYLHHALETLQLTSLGEDVQAVLDTAISGDISFGEALLAMRNRERTHGNLFRPGSLSSRKRARRDGEIAAALHVAPTHHAFVDCWNRIANEFGILADRLEDEMERIAPPEPAIVGMRLPEHMPRRAGPLGQLRMPREVILSLDPPAIGEKVYWQLRRRG